MLLDIGHYLHSDHGITWDTIEDTAFDLYPIDYDLLAKCQDCEAILTKSECAQENGSICDNCWGRHQPPSEQERRWRMI